MRCHGFSPATMKITQRYRELCHDCFDEWLASQRISDLNKTLRT